MSRNHSTKANLNANLTPGIKYAREVIDISLKIGAIQGMIEMGKVRNVAHWQAKRDSGLDIADYLLLSYEQELAQLQAQLPRMLKSWGLSMDFVTEKSERARKSKVAEIKEEQEEASY